MLHDPVFHREPKTAVPNHAVEQESAIILIPVISGNATSAIDPHDRKGGRFRIVPNATPGAQEGTIGFGYLVKGQPREFRISVGLRTRKFSFCPDLPILLNRSLEPCRVASGHPERYFSSVSKRPQQDLIIIFVEPYLAGKWRGICPASLPRLVLSVDSPNLTRHWIDIGDNQDGRLNPTPLTFPRSEKDRFIHR